MGALIRKSGSLVTHRLAQYRSRGWAELLPITLTGTALCLCVGLVLNYLLLFSDTLTPLARGAITALVIALAVGAPLSFLLAHARRSAGRYRRTLTQAASYDAGTNVLNGSVFSAMVERRAETPDTGGARQGAFLIVDAHGVKEIDMRHGFGWGEEALRLIAGTIRNAVRGEDLVGRLGNGEFGIFLPGASQDDARQVADRILAEVRQVYFAPGASRQEPIEIRVAGIQFEDTLKFDGMYRAAEERLSRLDDARPIDVRRFAPTTRLQERRSTAA